MHPTTQKARPYAILRNRDFLYYLLGRVMASFGQQMLTVAVGWEIYERDHSPLALSFVGSERLFWPMVVVTCRPDTFADHDLLAFVNNAAVLLRLTGRQAECEFSLFAPAIASRPAPVEGCCSFQVAQNRFDDAAVSLRGEPDPESRLLAAELVARRDDKEAIRLVEEIEATGQDHVMQLKSRILGDLALRVRDYERVDSAIANLTALPEGKLPAELLPTPPRRPARRRRGQTACAADGAGSARSSR